MAIGPCEYLLCNSVIGSRFRPSVYFNGGGGRIVEVLICPEHQRFLRSDGIGKVMMTPEGWLYTSYWIDSLGFYRWGI